MHNRPHGQTEGPIATRREHPWIFDGREDAGVEGRRWTGGRVGGWISRRMAGWDRRFEDSRMDGTGGACESRRAA